MANKISVVIHTLNEEKNITRAINSVKWTDEIIVCDMYSEDNTVVIARKLGAKVVFHKRTDYVEPARNFAISQATSPWIFILDADEEIPSTLNKKLQDIANEDKYDFVEIPRKNIIFGKWMKASNWWPDYHIRFFKKGSVAWKDEIHSKPEVSGKGLTLETSGELAIIHYHYASVFQFIERLNRYSTIQVKELKKSGYKFKWQDLIYKPLGEFLSRFFANRGFEDGLHGLALGLLQASSFLVMYLKLWETEKFKQQEINRFDLKGVSKQAGSEVNYWFKYGNLSGNIFKRIIQKIINKFS